MLDEYRVEYILNELGVDFNHKYGYFKCKCPVCGDSKKNHRSKRLKISRYKDFWSVYCWNGGCSVKGMNFYSLYSLITGVSYSDAKKYINNDTYQSHKIKKRLKPRKKNVVIEEERIKTPLDIDLSDCLKIDDKPQGKIQERFYKILEGFIIERKLYNHRDEIYIAYSGRYKARIIIPVVINNTMEYFQGRTVVGDETKYLNPVVDKELIILNSDKFSRDKYIIITEGIIDAFCVNYNQGTSCLGSYISDKLIKTLLGMTDKGIILAWDNPLIDICGKEEIISFIEGSQYGKTVKYFLPDRHDFKDLNDLKILDININIYDYVVKNSFSYLNAMVKLKLYK